VLSSRAELNSLPLQVGCLCCIHVDDVAVYHEMGEPVIRIDLRLVERTLN